MIPTPNQSYLDEGVQLLELAQSARRLFDRQEPREKRRLLDFVVSNCSWKAGELSVSFKQPFDILANATTAAVAVKASETSDLGQSEIWLPFLDTYRTMCIAPALDFRQVLEGVRELSLLSRAQRGQPFAASG
ncbi:MAG: hypothetical protein JO122_13875 [Acetobacteraceae bacterium]|nr:hypothetical protein [Acetobacteraceae bacterium]